VSVRAEAPIQGPSPLRRLQERRAERRLARIWKAATSTAKASFYFRAQQRLLARLGLIVSYLPLANRLTDLRLLGLRPEYGAWPEFAGEIPAELLTVAGIARDREQEQAAFDERPLLDFKKRFATEVKWTSNVMRATVGGPRQHLLNVLCDARAQRATREARRSNATAPRTVAETDRLSGPELTARIRAYATEIGLNTIGVAELDRKYQYAGDGAESGRVIVAVLGQNREQAQLVQPRSQMASHVANAALTERLTQLAQLLLAQGYKAHVYPDEGGGMILHYAVQSGIGQLGMNGQVLTPTAGARVRMFILHTDAPLELDAPRDYGVTGICGECGVCARRCPSGAIRRKPLQYRGITKWKIATERCQPVVGIAHGCAVCMKVCPVQKYGLEPVLDEFRRSGEILGKGSDELEAYRWPVDGRVYKARERPVLGDEVLQVAPLAEFNRRLAEDHLAATRGGAED
jgi:epoxyqueuosine reductase